MANNFTTRELKMKKLRRLPGRSGVGEEDFLLRGKNSSKRVENERHRQGPAPAKGAGIGEE